MIPKIIHYCWFGGNQLPELAKYCLESWNKYCPDYEIVRWDESNFDLNENIYVKEAYEQKKWAFVTDYVRLKALYEIGGVYMDTDVELIDSIEPFLVHEAFSGFENDSQIPTGIMASCKGHPFFEKLLKYYENRHFVKENGELDLKTNVYTITEIALNNGFVPNNQKQTVCGVTYYPNDYFCPKDYSTGIVFDTKNTVCIHHFNGSWHTEEEKKLIEAKKKFIRKYGKSGEYIFKFYKYLTHPQLIVKRFKRINKS